ncbi:MAG: isochorismatase family protein [archaeon]|nr:isochorismatase family protein [archaeon]
MKKELYFNQKNKKEKTEYWSDELKKIRNNRPFSLNLKKIALLILDMQNYFMDKNSHAFIPSAIYIIPEIQKIMDKVINNGGKIIFTRHIDNRNPEDLMNKWWNGKISEDFSLINPQFAIEKGKIITKNKYSAFHNTNLEEYLVKEGIQQLLITGVMTHLCCETTARDGFMRNFEVFFVMDATASYNEDFHLNSLKALTHGFCVCLSSEEILNWSG